MQNKLIRFFVAAGALYLVWYLVYELLLKPYTQVDAKIISFIITQAEFILKGIGYTTYRAIEEDNMQLLGIDGAHPVWIGAGCNALTLFAFFSLFVIAFPGPVKKKLWFIPLGLIIIHMANLIRVISLALLNFYAPDKLAFNHSYTFTIIVYGIIFALWMYWVRSVTAIEKADAKNP